MTTLRIIVFLFSSVLSQTVSAAQTWTVVSADSRIQFSGSHAGREFKGSFEKWTASIQFDPADLGGSKAVVTVDLGSARTGDATYDKTLPTADWFDIAKAPTGVFETTGFRSSGGDKFEADAALTVRGVKVPLTFAFEFKAAGDTARLQGRARLKRLDFGIGRGSDEPGEWVSLDIPVEVSVSLKKG